MQQKLEKLQRDANSENKTQAFEAKRELYALQGIQKELMVDKSGDYIKKFLALRTPNEAKTKLEFVISYNNQWKLLWDSLIIFLAIWNCMFVPFSIAFNPDESQAIIIINAVIDLFFYLDVAIQFRTSTITFQGVEITDTRLLALNYVMKGTFVIDILSVFPFERIPFSS